MQYSKAIFTAILVATAAADFTVFRVTDMKSVCVDAHCKPEPNGYSVRAAKFNDCKSASGDAEDLEGGGALNTGDGFIWKDGACGSVKDYKCKKVEDRKYECAGPDGQQKATCEGKKGEVPPMFTCHKGFSGNEVYNESLQCKGEISC